MLSKLLEPLTATCVAAGACVTVGAGGLPAVLVGGAALIARFHEQCAKSGLDSAALILKMRTAVVREWDRADSARPSLCVLKARCASRGR